MSNQEVFVELYHKYIKREGAAELAQRKVFERRRQQLVASE